MARTREILGGLKGALLIAASLFVLTPQMTGLTDLKRELAPGYAALSIALGFVLAVGAGYVFVASAGRKTLKRTLAFASIAVVGGLALMVCFRAESPQFQVARIVAVALGVLLGGYLRAPQPIRPIRPTLLSDTELRSRLEKRMGDSHEYSRHLMTNLVSWYTFFVTVNYVGMGWFAKQDKDSGSTQAGLVVVICAMFIVQNVLGMMACARVRRHLLEVSDEIVAIEQGLVGEELDRETRALLMPSAVYARAIQLMIIGLFTIVCAWIVLPILKVEPWAKEIGDHLIQWWS